MGKRPFEIRTRLLTSRPGTGRDASHKCYCLPDLRKVLRRREPLLAPGPARYERRRNAPSNNTAWLNKARRAVRSCACLAALRRRWRSGRLLRQARDWRGRGSAAFRRGRDAVLLRTRESLALDCRQSLIEDRNGALGIARRASASANAILSSPSNSKTFCSRSISAPRRMSSSPSATARRSGRPALEKHAESAEQDKVVLARIWASSELSSGRATGRGSSIRTWRRAFFRARVCWHG